MKRCMIALDVQSYYKPSAGIVHQIQELTGTYPTIGTLFIHDELKVPLEKLGQVGPGNDTTMIGGIETVNRHGYMLPDKILQWIKANEFNEALVTGGHNDANVLSVGFQLFDQGVKPIMIPLLCYGNDWYMHTVTTNIWRQNIGDVYETVAEMKFS